MRRTNPEAQRPNGSPPEPRCRSAGAGAPQAVHAAAKPRGTAGDAAGPSEPCASEVPTREKKEPASRPAALFCLVLVLVAAATAPAPLAAGIFSGSCRTGNQPAATLLVPYFEVDLGDPGGVTTRLAVANAAARAAVARIVLWTDWGIPTLAFDVYLTGFDVQNLDLRDLFAGKLPVTGPGENPTGALSLPGPSFPGCDTHLRSIFERDAAPAPSFARGGRVYQGPGAGLGPADVAYLRAAFGGTPLPGSAPPQCAGSLRPGGGGGSPQVAVGYVTVDSVSRCTPATVATLENTPAHALYFAAGGNGLANDDNVLWGAVTIQDAGGGVAVQQPAVSIVADPGSFRSGDYTFYGRYVGFDGRDDRAPLASLYFARFVDDPANSAGTDLVVWRDNRDAQVGPRRCGSSPSWSPLGELQLLVFDEQENPAAVPHSNAFPLTTQRVRVAGPSLPAAPQSGWALLDLWRADATHAQAWVGIWTRSAGRVFFAGEALRADDLCDFGP